MKRSILWFRNDLRLHDNEALLDALKHNEEIIPVYVFDDRFFKSKTKFGFEKTGAARKRFIAECVQDLRQNLKKLSTNLYVREGLTEEIIPEIARQYKTSYVYCNRDRTQEEVDMQDALEKSLWSIGQEMRYYRGKMLYYTADLPFPVTHCPDQFTPFRKEVEKFVKIRSPLVEPTENIKPLSEELEEGEIPYLSSNNCNNTHDKGLYQSGGETEGRKLLNKYIWTDQSIVEYKQLRNNLLGDSFSSKFSSYLSQGCLSPKLIYDEIKRFESERVSNESTYWLVFQLLWRDYFRFIAKKHGNKIFYKKGIKGKPLRNKLYSNKVLFDKWAQGMTGIPFVDANMRELNATGYMSNRGRQNVASFLVHDMHLNWLMGAEYFESKLIDYDPCTNYGNWNYIAGVGTDPRQDRYFNLPFQVKKYDPKAEYIRYWLPELEEAPLDFLVNPFSRPDVTKSAAFDYPQPCVHIKNWT